MNRKLNNIFELVLKQFKKEIEINDNIIIIHLSMKTKVELRQKKTNRNVQR